MTLCLYQEFMLNTKCFQKSQLRQIHQWGICGSGIFVLTCRVKIWRVPVRAFLWRFPLPIAHKLCMLLETTGSALTLHMLICQPPKHFYGNRLENPSKRYLSNLYVQLKGSLLSWKWCVFLSYLQRSRWHRQEVHLNQSVSAAQTHLLCHYHLQQLV